MCNIMPKVLEEKPKNINEIKSDLKKKFKIDITEESIIEILGEVEERNLAIQNGMGWLKIIP